jgi:hypothetical protein
MWLSDSAIFSLFLTTEGTEEKHSVSQSYFFNEILCDSVKKLHVVKR